MVLNHVADCPRSFIVATSAFYPNSLSSCNLYMIDIMVIPNRLKQSVAEAEDQNILYCLLTQVVINPVYLTFFENCANVFVQCTSRFQIVSKRLFNNHTPPVTVFLCKSNRA